MNKIIVPVINSPSCNIQVHPSPAYGLCTAAAHKHEIQGFCRGCAFFNQMFVKYIHFEFSMVCRDRPMIGLKVEIIVNHCLDIFLKLII